MPFGTEQPFFWGGLLTVLYRRKTQFPDGNLSRENFVVLKVLTREAAGTFNFFDLKKISVYTDDFCGNIFGGYIGACQFYADVDVGVCFIKLFNIFLIISVVMFFSLHCQSR